MKNDERDAARTATEPATTGKAIPTEALHDVSGGWVFIGMPLTPPSKACPICNKLMGMQFLESHMKECHGK